MAARTQKQREQWKQFNDLGQVLSLASWLRSKRGYVANIKVPSNYTKNNALSLIDLLVYELRMLALEAGYDPSKEPKYSSMAAKRKAKL